MQMSVAHYYCAHFLYCFCWGRGGGVAEGRGGGALAPGSTCAPFIFASSPLFSRALSLGPGLARAGPEQKDQRAHFQPKHVLRDRRIDFQKCEFVYAHVNTSNYIYIYIHILHAQPTPQTASRAAKLPHKQG